MHQETLLYMFHNLPYSKKKKLTAHGSQLREDSSPVVTSG
jgi:hypothetical protein